MHDLSLAALLVDFLQQDPVRALGLFGLACIAISITTEFDLLRLLGFVEVREDVQETSAA